MNVRVDGPAGVLDAVAVEGSEASMPFAVVCHPHPLQGGTMDNKVVTTVARALQACGMPTLRFNFRGVGGSAGTYDAGDGETLDALAAVAWGRRRWAGRDVVLAGFSFGAYIALRAAQSLPPARLITVAPPVGRFEFMPLAVPDCPWLVVQGDADEVVDPAAVRDWAETISPRPRLVMLPGVGHFFHGQLTVLRDLIEREIRSG